MKRKRMKKEGWPYNYITAIIVIMTFFSFLIFIASLSSDKLSSNNVDLSPSGKRPSLQGVTGCSPPLNYVSDPKCVYDLNGDTVVNDADESLLAPNIGRSASENGCWPYDFDENGIINLYDRAELRSYEGPC